MGAGDRFFFLGSLANVSHLRLLDVQFQVRADHPIAFQVAITRLSSDLGLFRNGFVGLPNTRDVFRLTQPE